MNKTVSKTTEKAAPKKVYKISIEFYPGFTAKITRKDLPQLIDTTDKSISWLEVHDFKAEDIELIGDKPDCWETYYPAPAPIVEPAPVVEPPLAEKIAEVLDAAIAEAATEKDAEALAETAAVVAEPIATEAPTVMPAEPAKE